MTTPYNPQDPYGQQQAQPPWQPPPPQAPYAQPQQPAWPPPPAPPPAPPQPPQPQAPYTQPSWPPPQAPQAPQGYYQQPAPQQAYYTQPPVPAGPPQPAPTVADYLAQPTGANGASLTGFLVNEGQSVTGIVARPVGRGDISLQTDPVTRQPLPPRGDGSRKLVMMVPLTVAQNGYFTDGRAAWYVRGADQAELARAMAAAGCPDDIRVPEYGAQITVTWTHTLPPRRTGMSPQKIRQVLYHRPAGVPQPPVTQQAYDTHTQETQPDYTRTRQPVPQIPVTGPGPWQQAPGQQPSFVQPPIPQPPVITPEDGYANAPQPPVPPVPPHIQAMVPQGPSAPANFANPQGHYGMPQAPAPDGAQQPQLPFPPTQPGGYAAPSPAPASASGAQQQTAPPPPSSPVPPPPMPAPGQPANAGQQVAYATQQAQMAAAANPPHPPAPQVPQPTPEQAALLARVAASQQAQPPASQPQG